MINFFKRAILQSSLYQHYKEFKKKERRVRYGNDYPDKIFYVIGQDDESGGLWWLINKAVMHIAYAKDNGFIPVIDLQNYKTQYTIEETFRKVNVWELFLDQPCGFSLDKNGNAPNNISRARNVIISKKEPSPSPDYLMGNTDFYDNPERLNYFREMFKRYIRFNSETTAFFEREKDRLFKGRRMCGVLCRGTDYVALKPQNHPVQPNPVDVINETKCVISKYNCEGVFLATEDRDILNLFKEAFGDILLYEDQPRLSQKDIVSGEMLALSKKRLNVSDSPLDDGLKYLVSTYLLSQCNCFISGRTGGCKGVLLMTSNFDYCKVYNLGLYA